MMIRPGDGRINALTDATVSVTILMVEEGSTGQSFRRAVDRRLARSDPPFFPLTWTLMHELGPDSSLAGLSADSPIVDDLRLVVSITARDPSLAAQVRDGRAYRGGAIAFGARYVDSVIWQGRDHSITDLRKISLIEPDAKATIGATSLSEDT